MTRDAVAGETARLTIEPLCAAHAAELFPLMADPHLYAFIPQSPPASEETLRERYAGLESRRSPDGQQQWLNWALRRRTHGVCIGRVEATVDDDGDAWVGFVIGAEFWRQGFATEAVRRLVEGLFADPHVRRVRATVDTRNAASMRLLDRLGFTRSAVSRPAEVIDGVATSEWEYGLARV